MLNFDSIKKILEQEEIIIIYDVLEDDIFDVYNTPRKKQIYFL